MANILVVDDEMGIRELLSEILGDEGHVVQLAETRSRHAWPDRKQNPIWCCWISGCPIPTASPYSKSGSAMVF